MPPPAFLPVHSKPQLMDRDYEFRPAELERFPLYFFIASCVAVTDPGPMSLPWMETHTPGDDGQPSVCTRQRSFIPKPVMSKTFPHRQLLHEDGNFIYEYGYYVHLLVDKSWRVPELHGRCPAVPHEKSSSSEKGEYALFSRKITGDPRTREHELILYT